ncbi:glycosyltransferase family 4 protein [Streptomyces winkii]|uniref:glycosyltransferase family 4 protein n=1 Tax=Streptomyces winkii TaxID=3051178 RepID=UPI0028D54DEA|nr:glycosyltransferase family 4 protein [Streptomyces sp. DSM 40971]
MPGDVDDPDSVSGGNTYDRRVCRELSASGTPVRETVVPGSWPRPSAAARAALATVLGELPDGAVVLVDGLVACGVPDVVVPQARRLRLAVLVHLPLADETGLAPAEAAELERLERETLRAAPAAVATSDWAAREITGRHGLEPSRVHAVLPGTDPAPLARGTDGASRLLCVAALTPRKGQDLLVEALAGLDGLPWTCELTGPLDRAPAYVAGLRRRIGECGLEERVRLTGARSGGDLDAAYDAADLFVLASHTETYGMVLTEALARGVPVLATDAGAVPSTVGTAPDGSIPGILVPTGDVTALTAALRRWLTDPGIRSHLTTSARGRRTKLQGWAESSRQLARVLESVRLE